MMSFFLLKEQTFAILEDLRYDMVTLLRWFKENSMKRNPKKIQFMILGKTPRQPIILNINQIKR